jgi:hypothetical protein
VEEPVSDNASSGEEDRRDDAWASSKSPDPADTDGACFPADDPVGLQCDAMIRMDEYGIDDSMRVGRETSSEVFAFTRRPASGVYYFVHIEKTGGLTSLASEGIFM